MTAISWKTSNTGTGITGSFFTAANWSTGAVPISTDDVTIAAPGSYTVTISGPNGDVNSLTLNAAGATLIDMSPDFFTVESAMTIAAGTLELTGDTEVLGKPNQTFKLSSGGTLLAGKGGGQLEFGSITTAGLINTGTDGLDFQTYANGGGMASTIGGTLAGTGSLLLFGGGSTGYNLAAAGLSGTASVTLDTILTVSASSTFAPVLQGYTSTLAIGHGANLTAASGVSLSTDAGAQSAFILSGPGMLTTKGVSTVNDLSSKGQSAELTGGITWVNSGTVTDSGMIAFNDSSVAADTATIVNAATGIFTISGADAGLVLNGAGTDLFTNSGTLARGGDSNISTLAATLVSTNTISITAGELDLEGGGTLSGTLSGAGALNLAGGNFSLGAGGLAGTSNLEIDSNLNVSANNTLAFNLTAWQGTLTVAKGISQTLTGAVQFGLPGFDFNGFTLSGLGTVSTTGVVTIGDDSIDSLGLSGGVTWINNGTANDGNGVAFNSGQTATILNAAKGVFNLGYDGIFSDGTGSATFTNAGTLTGGAGGGSTSFTATLNSTGTIDTGSGILDLSGGGTISGTLSGTGTLSLDSGSYTIGYLVGSGSIRDNGANVTYTSTTINTPYQLDNNQTLAISSAKTLTFKGALTVGDATGGGTISGPGTLVTTATTTINDLSGTQALALNGSLAWTNSGTVSEFGLVGSSGAVITNTGTFDFASDAATFTGSGSTDIFHNTGTLGKTDGAGTSLINDVVTSTGTVNVATGALVLGGGGSVSGVLTGGGALHLSNGNFTTAGLTGSGTLVIDNLVGFGYGTLTASATSTITAGVRLDGYATLGVAAAKILTLTGPFAVNTVESSPSPDGGFLNGPGTLTTTGATTIGTVTNSANNPALTLEGGLTWSNTGTVTDAGAGTSSNATIVNAGVFDFSADTGIYAGTAQDVFRNTGTLGKTGGTGISQILDVVTSTGIINVATGALVLGGGGSVSGTLSGAGALHLGNGSFTTTGISGSGNLVIDNLVGYGYGTLTASATSTITAGVRVDGDATLGAAKGVNLTLKGPFAVNTVESTPSPDGGTLTGAGTITTLGATTIGTVTNASNNAALALGGGITWANAATGIVTDAGAGTSSNATIVNAGVFDFSADTGIYAGTAQDVFRNTGTLGKTGGTGISQILDVVTSTGTINVATGALVMGGGGSVSGTLSGAGALHLSNGNFTTAGLTGSGNLVIDNLVGYGYGTLTASATSTITAGVRLDGYATLGVAAAKILTLTGPFAVNTVESSPSPDGGFLNGPGTLTTTGATTIGTVTNSANNPALTLEGGLTWSNTGTVTDAGAGTSSNATIVNAGVFDFSADTGIYAGTAQDVFRNTGTLGKTGGTGISQILDVVTSTGTINVATGALVLGGGGSVSGTLSGAGALHLGNGSFTTTGISGSGNLVIDNLVDYGYGTLTASATSTITAGVRLDGNAMLGVAAAKILTLTGPFAVNTVESSPSPDGGFLNGPGTLTTTGTTTIGTVTNSANNPALTLEGGVTWSNTGTATDAGATTSNGGTIANAGTFNFSADTGDISAASAADTLKNTGTLGKTGGTGTSLVSDIVTSTGTINVATGTLAFSAGGAVSGALLGTGQLDLSAGGFTTTGLSGAGHLAITGGTLTQTATGTIAPAFVLTGSGLLAVSPAAAILTLAGPVTLGDAGGGAGAISGPGTVSTIGTTAIFDDGAAVNTVVLEGGISWANSGTVNDAGAIGVANDGNDVAITNSGSFNLTSDDAGVGGPTDSITNTGTLAKTGGTGTSTISATIDNTGLISVASGTLALLTQVQLATNSTLGGTLSGAGVLALQYGTFYTTGLAGSGTLGLFANGSYDGVGDVTLTNTANATIADSVIVESDSTITPVAGTTLTFTGPVQLGAASGYARLIGPGTIATTGTTLLPDLGANVLDATAESGLTWNNSGTVSLGDVFYVDSSATIDNLAGGVFDLTSDDATITAPGGPPVGPISNAGTLAKTGGTGTSTIDAPISNTGTIEAAHGTLSLTGAITGTGHIKIDAGATLDAGTLPASQAIAFNGGAGATLKMEVPASIGTLTAFTAGDRLDLVGETVTAATVSGTTLTVTAGGVKTTYVSAGLAGQVATFGSDKNGGSFVSLYRAATATHSPEPLAFGNHHVGDKNVSLGLTVTNTAVADGYSEKLNASLGGATTGFTGAGTVTALAAGASNSTSLTVALDTSAAGTKTGTATLTLASNGTGVDGKGATPLAPQTVNLTGAIYNYAAASLASTSITLASYHVGDTASAFLTLSNTAAAGIYSEGLDAQFTAATGAATGTGSITLIAAGSSNSSSLSIGLAPTAGGVATGTETLTFISDGQGTSGLGTTTLGTQAVSVTGTFYALAAGTLASSVVAFGNHHVGDTIAAKFLKLTNGAPTGGFSEALDASLTATGAITATGSISKLAAGVSNSSSLSVGEVASAAGTIGGALLLNLISDGTGIDGLGTTTLLGQTITVTGANYALASGTLASSTVNLGVIHASTAASAALGLTNGAPTGGYGESLDAGLSGASAGLSTHGSISLLKAGVKDTSSLTVSVNTATTGQYSATTKLGLISDGAGTSGLGTTTLTSQTVTVTATVDNYAAAAFEDPAGPAITGSSSNATINLGSTLQGNGALTLSLGALNTATGLSDLLAGTISTAGGAGFTNSGFGAIGNLSAGQDEHAQTISLATGTAGTFSETVTLSTYGTNASGYKAALTPETLTITGTISPSVFHTYTLALGPNAIQGADGLGDIFVASAGALNTRDQLTGGSGANSIILSGAGLFDINAPSVFTNIPTINATEGQAATGSAADTRQTVMLRDGAAETLNIAAGTAASGNANAEAITVYAFAGTDTIALASGADQVFLGTGNASVTLGGVSNTVTAGGGTALVHSTAAFAGAAIAGQASGSTTLDITTGGAITLNAADTYVTVQLHAASNLKLSALSFITAIGSSSADTLTALATSQTLTGGAGADILNGFSGGNDSFADTAAGLNGDTINTWTTGDVIDITNIAAAGLHPLTFASNTLTATNGTTSTAIKFAAGNTLGNFTVLGADSAGTGVLIGFHA